MDFWHSARRASKYDARQNSIRHREWSSLRNVSFHQWEDAFEVEFDDGLSFLEPHRTICKANKIAADAVPIAVELEPETRSGFPVSPKLTEGGFVHYANGQTAEVS